MRSEAATKYIDIIMKDIEIEQIAKNTTKNHFELMRSSQNLQICKGPDCEKIMVEPIKLPC